LSKTLEPKEKQANDRVPSGVRSLYILEVLAKAGAPMTATDINLVLQLPKPTIHRLCNRLEEEGFLKKDLDGKRYLPGKRLQTITTGVTHFTSFVHARHSVLKQLSELVGETCNITIPIIDGMQYIDRVETRWPLRFQFPIGDSVPFHCTASGKLYLSSLPKAQREKLLRTLPLDKFARNTLVDPDKLLDALEETRRNKIGTDDEEFVDGMVAIAVPIEDENSKLIATLAMHVPVQRMSIEDALEHADSFQQAAQRIKTTFVE
jgi:DNA-binding IclR family transcriptional regulator